MRNEPELRSLYEWLDTQTHGGSGKQGAIVGSVVGCSFAIAVMLGVLLLKNAHGGMHSTPWLMLGPIAGATLLSVATCGWVFLKSASKRRETWRRLGGTRSFVWKLWSARWSGNVGGLIGQESANALNSAAYEYLRCQAALSSPAWRGLTPDSAWLATRDKVEAAMEGAMGQLMMTISQGGTPERPEVVRLLDDMRQTADEIVKTADKLAVRKGLTGDISDELRSALSEMRVLNAAHDEVMQIDVRH